MWTEVRRVARREGRAGGAAAPWWAEWAGSRLLLAASGLRGGRRRRLSVQAFDEGIQARADGGEAVQRLEFRLLLNALEPGAGVVGERPEPRQDDALDKLLL